MWWSRLLTTVVALLAVAGAGLGMQPSATLPVPPPPAPPAPPPPPPPPPPPVGPPVLAVKVDNAPTARPPTGVEAADVVYVEPVEAGISRLVAVFASRVPPVVGPVRSARETDLRLLPQFGHPALAFSGAAPELLPDIAAAPVTPASEAEEPGAYFRGPGTAPHNLFVRPEQLPDGAGWSPRAPLHIGPPPPGGRPSGGERISYPAAAIGVEPAPGGWSVVMDGEPLTTAGGAPLRPGTVVLQEVDVHGSGLQDVSGNTSPYAETVGEGRAVVLRDGRSYDARWSRPDPAAGTAYTTTEGEPMTFAPGQVWVVLVQR
ncbi:DUF3048 domain-containing protein [Saccharopolyspora sp. HNM0983]|uniref:DUF3048 domain-containing protein n=1 Tax=Saccharopolyspora montiporae TaxID=2781240 RepID=A0A929G1F7_9PSEU|nr:DUF3048 domain-containing protein [Saccharopolyspora sp. HNM0983]MBE9374633.1 DUF3048 domain-containing protein [Saccharopolyspora sp. HNM0983]